MARPCVSVIDSSASIRETIAILLPDCEVRGFAPEDWLRRNPSSFVPDLIIVEELTIPTPSLTHFPAGVPILWLCKGKAIWRTPQQAGLPRSFSASALREEAERLLAGSRSSIRDPAIDPLAPPFLQRETAHVAAIAAQTNFPVLIHGEPGSGKLHAAREIHARSGYSDLLSVTASECTTELHQHLRSGTNPLSLVINDIERLSRKGQQFLLDLLASEGVRCGPDLRPIRLLCLSTLTVEEITSSGRIDVDLLHQLTVFPIWLSALRERPEDIPAIAQSMAHRISRRLKVPEASFTPEALHRLTHYLWFGNLAELEAVLARTLALVSRRPIAAEDLRFGYGDPTTAGPAASAGTTHMESEIAQSGTAAVLPLPGVELLINELAHEFKNPMVTIKTISQHMDRLLADESSRHEVAQLASEAVERMDRSLEHLLQFTRFNMPAQADITLNALLAPCLTELAALLTERGIVLNYQPPPSTVVHVDREQIIYAIDSLLRSLLRDLAEGDILTVRAGPLPPVLSIETEAARHSVADKLHQYLDDPTQVDRAESLGFLFARSLIERNGGQLKTIVRDGIKQSLISLPRNEGYEVSHGKAPRTDR